MAKHILKREQGRIGINRFQSTGGNDNAARIRSKRRSRNLCKMPDKEDAALVLPIPKNPMSPLQRPYVSTSETYYKENAINPPQPAKRSIKVNFFSTFFFLIFISLSLLLKKSTYHAPYHQTHFLFFFPTAFLTRFVLPTSFFTSSLASSIAIRSRRSSAISSCSVGRWSLYLAAKMRLLL